MSCQDRLSWPAQPSSPFSLAWIDGSRLMSASADHILSRSIKVDKAAEGSSSGEATPVSPSSRCFNFFRFFCFAGTYVGI